MATKRKRKHYDVEEIKGIVRLAEQRITTLNQEISKVQSSITPLVLERQEINYFLIRRRLTNAERETIWKRDGKHCYLCGESIESWRGEHMHVDHVDAWSRGGTNDIANLRATHVRCNLKKSNNPPPIDDN